MHYTRWKRQGDPEHRFPWEVRDGKRICADCSEDTPVESFSSGSSYCKPCVARRKRENYSPRDPRQLPLIHCIHCGLQFQPTERRSFVCSDGCRRLRARALDDYYHRQDGGLANRSSHRRWQSKNPRARAEIQARRRARIAGSTVLPITQDALTQRMAYFGDVCWMCGGAFECIDHVKPLSKGGPHLLANLRPSCTACNTSKSDKWNGVMSILSLAA